jgi:hypothetical protein
MVFRQYGTPLTSGLIPQMILICSCLIKISAIIFFIAFIQMMHYVSVTEILGMQAKSVNIYEAWCHAMDHQKLVGAKLKFWSFSSD